MSKLKVSKQCLPYLKLPSLCLPFLFLLFLLRFVKQKNQKKFPVESPNNNSVHNPNTPWDCQICRPIDPPWHHPWPFLGSPMAVPWSNQGQLRPSPLTRIHSPPPQLDARAPGLAKTSCCLTWNWSSQPCSNSRAAWHAWPLGWLQVERKKESP